MRFDLWWQPIFLVCMMTPMLLFIAPHVHGARSFYYILAAVCVVMGGLMVTLNIRQWRKNKVR